MLERKKQAQLQSRNRWRTTSSNSSVRRHQACCGRAGCIGESKEFFSKSGFDKLSGSELSRLRSKPHKGPRTDQITWDGSPKGSVKSQTATLRSAGHYYSSSDKRHGIRVGQDTCSSNDEFVIAIVRDFSWYTIRKFNYSTCPLPFRPRLKHRRS